MLRHLPVATLLALCAGPGHGREPPTITILDETLTATPPLAGGPVTVIDRQSVEFANATTLGQVLAGQAGIQLTDLYGDGTTTTVDLRGFGATAPSNVLILVDGRRLNNSADIGAPALGQIPLEQVERIEITRGSAGVRHGNQAVGGVVNIVTRDPGLPSAYLEAGAGTHDTLIARGAATATFADNAFARLAANYRETDNYREHNRLRSDLVDFTLEHRFPASRLIAAAGHTRERLQTPGSLFADELEEDRRMSAAVYEDDFSHTDTTTARLSFRHAPGGAWYVDADLNWRDEDRRFLTSFRAFPGSDARQDRRTWRFAPKLGGLMPLGNLDVDLAAGVDIERTDYRLDSQFGVQAMDQAVDGLFAEAGLQAGPSVSTLLGLRYTRVRNRIENGETISLPDSITTATLGIDYRPDGQWALFLRADQNFRLAAVDEHTNVIFGQPVGLDNQRGVSYEAGAEWRSGGDEWRLTAYRLDLTDEISFNADTFTNVNLPRTRRYGATVEGRWRITPVLSADAQYTWTDGRITAGPLDGNRIPLVAEHVARGGIEHRLSGRVVMLAEVLYTGDRILGGDYENAFEPLDGYTLCNAALTWESGGWRLRGRIDNVFNEKYSSSGAVGLDEQFRATPAFFPAPERRFSVTLRHDL
jgi:iron complex outermembrane receptor protein